MVVVAIAVIVANVAMMIAGAVSIGVSVDEPTHLLRFQNFLDFGWYVESWELEESVLQNGQKVYAYGPVVAQASAWNRRTRWA